MRKGVWIIGIALCLQSSHAFAQDDCLKRFTRVLEKTKAMRAEAGNGFQMDCKIIVTAPDGKVSRESMSIISQGKKFRYNTSKYALYQDAETLLVIQHDRKVVYVSKPVPETLRETQFAGILKLQDSIQGYMKLIGCEREFGTVNPAEGYEKLRFVPGEEIKNSVFKAVTYWIETSKEEVRKIAVDYQANSDLPIKSYVMLINSLDTGKKDSPFEGGALTVAFTAGKLKNEFKGYQLIDKRR
jgi:hypothetical protein